mmetsp:Transcript_100011/g.178000  ORF Transcript_100011/g.178000 Transcript_100011/m.178000 type:complete len:81 (+) Transcript_100011:195-437(+)
MPQESAEYPARATSSAAKDTTAGADAVLRKGFEEKLVRGDEGGSRAPLVRGVEGFAGLDDLRRCSARLLGCGGGRGGDAL